MGPAHLAAIVPAQEGFETALGILEVADGILTCPREIPDGFIFNRGDIDRGAIS